MTDYYCQVSGNYNGTANWSFALNVTSTQAEQPLLNTWSTLWQNAWTNATYGLDTLYATTVNITQLSVATVDQNYKQISKSRTTSTLSGTSTDVTLPYQNALVVSLRSAMVGRHSRGRFYLPAPVESSITNNTLTAAAITRVKSAVESVRVGIIADGSTIFVVHKPTKNPPTVPGLKYVIQDFLVSNKPARQSRRANHQKASYT